MTPAVLVRVIPIVVGAAVVAVGAVRQDIPVLTAGVALLGAPGAAQLTMPTAPDPDPDPDPVLSPDR